MKKTDLAYLAGFFDGEGSIFLTKASRNAGLELRISISQANRWICEKYRMAFGGAIVKDRNSKPDSWKCAGQWRAGANIGLEFLKVVYPYLILKQAEARIAIEFQTTKSSRFANSNRVRKLTEEELAVEGAQRILLHTLKDKSKA